MQGVSRLKRGLCESAIALALALAPAALSAQQAPAPASQQPPAAPQTQPATTPAPPAASSARIFTAPTGMIINPVRAERVADFEKLIGYLQSALATSSDATVRAQAEGWRVLKATETGQIGRASCRQ